MQGEIAVCCPRTQGGTLELVQAVGLTVWNFKTHAQTKFGCKPANRHNPITYVTNLAADVAKLDVVCRAHQGGPAIKYPSYLARHNILFSGLVQLCGPM